MLGLLYSRTYKILGICIGLILLFLLILANIIWGANPISLQTMMESFTQFNGSNDHIVIKDVRFPRAIIAAVVGISLGIAGVLLQSLTKNPLADLGLFGVNSGASFAVVCAIFFFSITSLTSLMWFAFLGAAISGLIVYVLGSTGRQGPSPTHLVLAGAAMTALFSSAIQSILNLNERTLDEIIFWLAGSLANRNLSMLVDLSPFLFVAWIGAFLLAKPINTYLLGEEVAKGLGQQTVFVKLATGIVIILLSGSTVAIVGPVGLVGLLTPHIAKYFVGIHIQWLIIYSAILGGCLLLLADLAAKLIAIPSEIPIGVMTALLGVPFFVLIARKGGKMA